MACVPLCMAPSDWPPSRATDLTVCLLSESRSGPSPCPPLQPFLIHPHIHQEGREGAQGGGRGCAEGEHSLEAGSLTPDMKVIVWVTSDGLLN